MSYFSFRVISFANFFSHSWFVISSDIYSFINGFELLISMLGLAVCIFQLDLVCFIWFCLFSFKLIVLFQKSQDLDVNAAIFVLVAMCALLNLFIHCYYGKLASFSYEQMANCIFESNWKDLPNNLQKYFIIIIANAQKPIFYHAFNVVVLNLETFAKVSAMEL